MIKKIIFVGVILIVLFSVFFLRNKTGPLVNPAVTPLSSPGINQPVNQPKEVEYDSSTDLKKELETIDPQISDSDF